MPRIASMATIREAGIKAKAVAADPTIPAAQKKSMLDQLDQQMNEAQADIALHASINKKYAGLADGVDAEGFIPEGSTALPAFGMDEATLKAFHRAVVSHQSIKINASVPVTKANTISATSASDAVPQNYIGMIPFQHEPTRVASLLPASQNGAPSVEYVRHDSTTGAASIAAPGGAYSSVTMNLTKVISTARKVTALTAINDEDLLDLADFRSYVGAELYRIIVDAENAQLLNGDGTDPNLQGLLNITGYIAIDNSVTPLSPLDVVQRAATQLRNGPAKCSPDGIVLNPADWETVVTAKDSYGRYLLGEPGMMTTPNMWGVPVILTTQQTAGTAIVANFGQLGAIHWRQALTLESSYGTAGFEHGTTSIRAEERLGLIVARPAAMAVITSF